MKNTRTKSFILYINEREREREEKKVKIHLHYDISFFVLLSINQ